MRSAARNLAPNEPTTYHNESLRLSRESTQPPVVGQRPEIDDLVGLEGKPAGRATGGEQQAVEGVHRSLIVAEPLAAWVNTDDAPPAMQRHADQLGFAPDRVLGVALP